MGARQGCSPVTMALAAGQAQRLLVEAGSILVVTQGALTVRFPFVWLAEKVVARELSVRAEEAHCFQEGGWIDLLALGSVEALLLPPDDIGLWARAGQCLARLLTAARTPTGGPEMGAPGSGKLRETEAGCGKSQIFPAARGVLR